MINYITGFFAVLIVFALMLGVARGVYHIMEWFR